MESNCNLDLIEDGAKVNNENNLILRGYEKYSCTVCNFRISPGCVSEAIFVSHPILDVLICKKCHGHYLYKYSVQILDKRSLCCWCHNQGRESKSCKSCSLNFCIKCLNRNFNNHLFNKILNSKTWICFKCDASPLCELRDLCSDFFRIVGNNRMISSLKNSQESVISNGTVKLRTRRNTWSGISKSDATDIKDKFVKKSDELLNLFEKVSGEVVHFKTKIDNNFKMNRATKAFSFLKELIKTTKCTLDLWDFEIKHWERSHKDNQESRNGYRKKKFSLSLRKRYLSTTDEEDIEKMNENSKENRVPDSPQANPNINQCDAVPNLMEINDNPDAEKEKSIQDNIACEQINNDSSNSYDSIFSHTTQIFSNKNSGIGDELGEQNGIVESIDRDNAGEEEHQDDAGTESDSENSFVFDIQGSSPKANESNSVEMNGVSSDYQENISEFLDKTGSTSPEHCETIDKLQALDATLLSNVTGDIDDEFVEATFDWGIPNQSTEASETDEAAKKTFLNSLNLLAKDENCDLQTNEKEIEKKEEKEEQQNTIVESILRNIDEQLGHLSEDNSSTSDWEDIDDTDNYLNLPKGVVAIVTHKLPSLPLDAEMDSVDADINREISKSPSNVNMKPCSVYLEKIDGNANEAIDTERPKATTAEIEAMEIESLLNLDGIGRKRKTGSPTANVKTKKSKKSDVGTKSDSESSVPSDEEDACLDLALPLLEEAPKCPTPTEDESVILDDLLNGMNDEIEDVLDELELDISSPTKKKRRSLSTDSNKENCPDETSVSKEPDGEDQLKRKDGWKADPLLRSSLSCKKGKEQQKEQLDINVEGDNILPDDLKRQMEKQEAKKLNKEKNMLENKKTAPSVTEFDNVSISSDDDDDDFESKYNKIIINSESDSDIEFVSVAKTKKKKHEKNTTDEVKDDDVSVKEENSDEESSGKKKGRRNIRAILDDETLDEATKLANLVEKERKSRLTQKHKSMNSFLSQSQLSQEIEGLILDIDDATEVPTVVVHPRILQKFKNHQKEGVKFMWESCYEGVKQIQKGDPGSGCILAHCMGLGKTFQVIALIHTLFAHPVTNTKSVVIVCPLSVVLNWKKEFEDCFKLTNDNIVNVFEISDGSALLRRWFLIEKFREKGGVLVLGYECYQKLISPKDPNNIARREANIYKTLCDPGPDLIVLDEGHIIKNGKAIRSKALHKVRTKRRIVLTGTPLQNNLMEYYFMVEFIKPKLLGSIEEYKNRFVNPITNGQYDDSTETDIKQMKKRSHILHSMLRGSIQRFEVSELRPYLSKKHDYALFVSLHPLQMLLYNMKTDIENSNTDDAPSLNQLVTNYHKFQIIWTHPYLFELKKNQKNVKHLKKSMNDINLDVVNDDLWWQSLCPSDCSTNIDYGPKFKVMLSIIKECENLGDKILVFSNSLIELDAIEHFLKQTSTPSCQWEKDKDYLRLDGSTPPESRVQLCNGFNDAANVRSRLFLISLKAGGLGLNLTGANRVILMDVSWNPALDNQSVFRTYRFGQEKECYVYRLVSMGTMEEVVYERQITKLAISGRVVDSMQISRHYKCSDLQIIYRSNFQNNATRPTLPLPTDNVLASVLQSCVEVFKYHEHQSLLENLPEENLNEDEMKIAWDEFNKENELKQQQIEQQKRRSAAMQAGPSGVVPPPPPHRVAENPVPVNVNVSKNIAFEQVNVNYTPLTLLEHLSSKPTFVKEVPKLNASTIKVPQSDPIPTSAAHHSVKLLEHTYCKQINDNKTESTRANPSTNREVTKTQLGYVLPAPPLVNISGTNKQTDNAKNVPERNNVQPAPNISKYVRCYNSNINRFKPGPNHVNLAPNDPKRSKTFTPNPFLKPNLFRNPTSVVRPQIDNLPLPARMKNQIITIMKDAPPPPVRINKPNSTITNDLQIPAVSNTKDLLTTSKGSTTVAAAVAAGDAVINIDDLNDEDLRKKENHAILSSLNRNLDITLSAISSKEKLPSGVQTSAPIVAISGLNVPSKQDDVIEID